MKFVIYRLLFEVTRRCNLKCAHCMRGDAQNIDLTKEHVDAFFNLNQIRSINYLAFSGGEPTLNPGIISYTVDKIIDEHIPVYSMGLITNGQLYSEEIVSAFNKFTDYRRKEDMDRYAKKNLESLIKEAKTKKYTFIGFSVDQYHKDMNPDIKKAYFKNEDKIIFDYNVLTDEDLIKTGRSNKGQDIDYKIDLKYGVKDIEDCTIQTYTYLTANGKLTTTGMGTYEAMDKINMGNVEDMPLSEAIIKYGKADSMPISFSPNFKHLRKQL